MTDPRDTSPARRRLLAQLGLLGASGLLPVSALAQAKASQASMQYQDSPKNGQRCADCRYFIPAGTAGEPGQCEIVKGEIAAEGYCIAWVAKS